MVLHTVQNFYSSGFGLFGAKTRSKCYTSILISSKDEVCLQAWVELPTEQMLPELSSELVLFGRFFIIHIS